MIDNFSHLDNFHLLVITFIFIAISGIIVTAFFFYFMINSDRKAQKERTRNNKTEHESLGKITLESQEKNDKKSELLLKDFKKVIEKLSIVEIILKNEVVNNSNLKQKLHVIVESLNYSDNEIETAKFKKAVYEIIDVLAMFYKKLRTEKKDKIEYQNLKKMLGKLSEIFLINEIFDITEIEKINQIAAYILNDFNNSKAESNNIVLITEKFRIFLKEIYSIYIRCGKKKIDNFSKENSIKIKGNENNTLQDIQAETININLPK